LLAIQGRLKAGLQSFCRYFGERRSGATTDFLGRCWRLAVSVAGRDFRLDWHERVRAGESFAFSVAPERCTIVPADGLLPAE